MNPISPSLSAKDADPAAADDRKRLRLARSIYGFYGAEGYALREAVDAMRTHPRLLRLVEQSGGTQPPLCSSQ